MPNQSRAQRTCFSLTTDKLVNGRFYFWGEKNYIDLILGDNR